MSDTEETPGEEEVVVPQPDADPEPGGDADPDDAVDEEADGEESA